MLIAPNSESSPGLFLERSEVIAILPGELGSGYVVVFRDGRTLNVSASTGEAILKSLA